MSHLDEQIAEALTHGPDTLTYILAQEVVRLRAIPADRSLGDRMVQISAELLAAYEELWDMARIRCRATTEKEYGKQWREINALRANQGGAAA